MVMIVICAAQPIKPNGGDDAGDYPCAAPPIEPIISHPSPQIPPRAVPPSTTQRFRIEFWILYSTFCTRGASDDDEDEDDGDWDVLWKVSPISLSALAYPPSIRPAADIA